MMGGEKMIHVLRLGVREMRIVCVASQQSGSSAGEHDEDRQPAVVEITGKPLALDQFAKRKVESCLGRSHEQITLSCKNPRQTRGAGPQPLIGNNPGTIEEMREVKGAVKMIPIPMREDDWRLLASLDVKIGRKAVAIERNRKPDIEVQNGPAGIIAK